ncbi:MAG: archaellin/type IV pilin N-terminal domain-containing protein [Candidatus Pacearchaeota archaeon]
MKNEKGISGFVAAVLLIAFTVSVGSLISMWMLGFTRTSTETVGKEASTQISCSYASVDLRDLKYNNSYLSGKFVNTGTVNLGNLSLFILLTNASQLRYNLCLADNKVVNCTDSHNLTLAPADIRSFNFSSPNNYDKIRLTTNCTNAYDEASSSDVSTS